MQDARDEIRQKTETVKDKDLELMGLRKNFQQREHDLQSQMEALAIRLDAVDKKLKSSPRWNKVETLQAQLDNANEMIKKLEARLKQLQLPFENDSKGLKLQQALDKIEAQGLQIRELVRKLQAAGAGTDLAQVADKS